MICPRPLLHDFPVGRRPHLQLAQLGWFYRYEAYLVILGLVSAATFFVPFRDSLRGRPLALRATVYILPAFATLSLAWRAKTGSGEILLPPLRPGKGGRTLETEHPQPS